MTGVDWLGLLGVVMVGGSILVAILAVVFAIVRDARRAFELRAAERRAHERHEAAAGIDDDTHSQLVAVLEPHRRRGELRVIHGGRRNPHGGAA